MAQLKKKRSLRAPSVSVRQQAERAGAPPKKRRLRQTAGQAGRPFRAAHRVGKKEFYLPLPDNRVGRFLNKRRRVTPSYFRNAWQEVRQVQWPNRKETAKLTVAVFVFAALFGVIIAVTDYGLDKLFRKVLLK